MKECAKRAGDISAVGEPLSFVRSVYITNFQRVLYNIFISLKLYQVVYIGIISYYICYSYVALLHSSILLHLLEENIKIMQPNDSNCKFMMLFEHCWIYKMILPLEFCDVLSTSVTLFCLLAHDVYTSSLIY